jgi:signal peptidase I
MNDLCSLIVILILLATFIFMAFVFFHSIPSQTLNWTIN